jgi:ABC-type branched-subunit amino acid transport system substrate-binding protein
LPQIALSSRLTHAAAALAASALTLGLAACGGSDDSSSGDADRLRIGLEAPLSGDLQAAGEGMLNGVRLAADEINARGGVEGKDIEIVPIDDGGDPEIGVPAAQKAIDDGLSGVVAAWNTGVGIETLPLYENAGLVPIRLAAGNELAGLGFTVSPMSSQVAPVTADALSKWIGAQTVAIGFDPTQSYSREMSRAVRSRLESAGVEITAFEPVEPGAEDYSHTVKRLSAGNPDAIFYSVYFPEGALIAKATPSGGSSPACLLGYASYDTGYVEDAGATAARNCKVVGLPAPDEFDGSTSHVTDYEDRFGEAPGAMSPYAYDSLNVLAHGVEQAGGFGAGALTAALNEVSGLMGWTGPITLEQGTGNRVPSTATVDEVDERGVLSVDPSWAKAVGAPY